MGNIKSHLIDYGYNLDFSYDDDLCSRELVKHLGKKKYIEFRALLHKRSIKK